MASTVDQIKQLIYEQIALKPSLALIVNNPSQVAIWKDFVHSLAVLLGVKEQLQDEFKANVEAIIEVAPVSTTSWVRDRAFEFQYDAATPQVLQLVEIIPPQVPVLVPKYVPVDVTKRILSVCVIRFSTSRILEMLVAKNTPPVKLTTPELDSLKGYFNDGGSSSDQGTGLGIAGIAYAIDSLDPDLVFIEGTIYVDGQYSATIKASIISAIEAYLGSLGPKGALDVLQLINAIQGVTGVRDMELVNVAIRSSVTPFGSKTFLIQASEQLSRFELATAGYALGETDPTNTLADKITIAIA
jgi:hypothetical protein